MADYVVNTEFTADTKDFDKGVSKVKNSLSDFSKQLTKGVVTGNLYTDAIKLAGKAVLALGNEVRKGITDYEQSRQKQEILAKTIEVTGASAWTSAENLNNMANSLQNLTNYDNDSITELQTVLLGFKNIKGDNFDEATNAILDMASVMGMDLVSATQAIGKALDDPIKGMGSLSRQGFAFTEEQKKVMQSMIDTGNIAKAQKIILDELNTTYGGASKAVDATKQLKNSYSDLRKAVGRTMVLSLDTDNFKNKLKDATDSFADAMNKMADVKERSDKLIEAMDAESKGNATEEQKLILLEREYEKRKLLNDQAQESVRLGVHVSTTTLQYYNVEMQKAKLAVEQKKAQIQKEKELSEQAKKRIQDAMNEGKELDRINKLVDDNTTAMQAEIAEIEKKAQLQGKSADNQEKLNTYIKYYISLLNADESITEENNEELKNRKIIIDNLVLSIQNQTKEIENTKKETEDAIKTTQSWAEAWKKVTEEIKYDADDWSDVVGSIKNQLSELSVGLSKSLGEALIDTGDGFRNMGAIALNALSEILSALSAQLTAMAVLNVATENYGKAIALGAGAVGAGVASGVASGYASKIQAQQTEQLESLSEATKELTEATKNLNAQSIDEFVQSIKKATSSEVLKGIENTRNELLDMYDNLGTQYNDLTKQFNEVNEYYKKYQYAMSDNQGFKNIYNSMLADYNKGLSAYNQLQEEYNQTLKVYEESVAQADNLRKEIRDTVNNSLEDSRSMVNAYKELFNRSSELFGDYWEDVTKALKKTKISDDLQSVYEDFLYAGQTMKNKILDGIMGGDSKEDIKLTLKKYFTELFSKKYIDEYMSGQGLYIGEWLDDYINGKSTGDDTVAKVDSIIDTISDKVKSYSDALTKIFGETKEAVTEITETISETKIDTYSIDKRLLQQSVSYLQAQEETADTFEKIKDYKLQILELDKEHELANAKSEEEYSKILQYYTIEIDNLKKQVYTVTNEVATVVEESTRTLADDVTDNITDAFTDGLNGGDFWSAIKNTLKNMIIQMAVFTDEFKGKLTEIGRRIADGIKSGFTDGGLLDLKVELADMFEGASAVANSATSILDSVIPTVNSSDGTTTTSSSKVTNISYTFNSPTELSPAEMIAKIQQTNREMSASGIF